MIFQLEPSLFLRRNHGARKLGISTFFRIPDLLDIRRYLSLSLFEAGFVHIQKNNGDMVPSQPRRTVIGWVSA